MVSGALCALVLRWFFSGSFCSECGSWLLDLLDGRLCSTASLLCGNGRNGRVRRLSKNSALGLAPMLCVTAPWPLAIFRSFFRGPCRAIAGPLLATPPPSLFYGPSVAFTPAGRNRNQSPVSSFLLRYSRLLHRAVQAPRLCSSPFLHHRRL